MPLRFIDSGVLPKAPRPESIDRVGAYFIGSQFPSAVVSANSATQTSPHTPTKAGRRPLRLAKPSTHGPRARHRIVARGFVVACHRCRARRTQGGPRGPPFWCSLRRAASPTTLRPYLTPLAPQPQPTTQQQQLQQQQQAPPARPPCPSLIGSRSGRRGGACSSTGTRRSTPMAARDGAGCRRSPRPPHSSSGLGLGTAGFFRAAQRRTDRQALRRRRGCRTGVGMSRRP